MFVRIFLVGLLIAIVPFGVFGQTVSGFATREESLKVLQHDLRLSDSQVVRAKELVEARQEPLQTIRQQAKPAFEEFVRVLRQPAPDPQEVSKAAAAFRQIHERAVAEQENSEKKFLSLLNPQQQQTVNGLQSKTPLALALHRLGLFTPGRSNEQASLQ
jgi:uncharacterized membrane protein